VIAVTRVRILNDKTEDYENEYRIYKNGTLETIFTTKYFEAVYFKPLDEAEVDLENALTRVNKDRKEGSEMQKNIIRDGRGSFQRKNIGRTGMRKTTRMIA
jgi:hypothetical protein